MAKNTVNLKIADIIIRIESCFELEQFTDKEKKQLFSQRYENFYYFGREEPEISINLEIADKLPSVRDAKTIFITRHFQDGSENWRLLEKGGTYVYKCPVEDKQQLSMINGAFDRAKVNLLPKKNKGFVWNINDVIYDFLQVLLIHYSALNKRGIFAHAMGVKDLDGKGLLFAGKSGAGKTTTAKLWHRHSKAMVLNDDRVIVRKINGKFHIYGSPWHGEFSDYLDSRIESAPLDKIFFIHHAPGNMARRILAGEAFGSLYPALFPAFWDKKCLENTASFCSDLVGNVPCYRLGFAKNKKVIGFVREIE